MTATVTETRVRSRLQELCSKLDREHEAMGTSSPFVIQNPRLVINVQHLHLDIDTLEMLLKKAEGPE